MRPEIEQAIALLRRGDDKAVEQALVLLQNTVFSFSMRVCGQREDAEDTMQEVLAKSLPYLAKFESPKALLVWLYKVARSRCLLSRRRSKFAPRETLSLDELMPDRREREHLAIEGSINPEVFAIRSQEAGQMRKAIQKLAAPYRIILVLRDMEGLTDDEVAEITGLRSGTVRVRLHRARLFVRRELTKAWAAASAGRTRQMKVGADHPLRKPGCKAMFAELSNYLDERLDDSLCDEIEQHLQGCAPCEAFLATLKATVDQCRNAPAEFPNGEKAQRLRGELLENYQRARRAAGLGS